MPLPSLQVLGITAQGDPSLFESLMAKAGFRVVPREDDPLSTSVQEEAVSAIASAITEDAYHGVRLSPYHKQAKRIAESAGYVVMIENCGPLGSDPCAGDFDDGIDEIGDDMGMDVPQIEPENREIEQIAALPLGTELAAQVLAVINGEGTDAIMGDEDPDAGLHGEMPMGGEELPPGPDDEMGDEMVPLAEVGEGEALLADEGDEPKEEPAKDDSEGRPF